MTQPATVVGESDFLTRHLAYIAEQPWVDEFYDELVKLLTVLKRVNGDPDDKPVGRCYLPQHDGLCGGAVWLDMIEGRASCSRCGTHWTGADLAHEERRMIEEKRPKNENGEAMQTVAELAELYNVTASSMRRRLNLHGAVSDQGYYNPALARLAIKTKTGS